MPFAKPIVVLSCAAALAACATQAPVPAPLGGARVPVSWTEPAPAAAQQPDDIAGWWRRFGDEQLTQWVEAALRANADLAVAEANLRRARALRDVSVAGSLPLLGGSVGAQRSRSNAGAAATLFDAGFDAAWETDLFGAVRHGVRASEAGAQASEARLAATRVSIAAEVAIDCIAWRTARQRLALTRQSVQRLAHSLEIAQWRERAGLATTLDVLQAETALKQTQAQLPALEDSSATLAHALAVLMGEAPGAVGGLNDADAKTDARPIPVAPATLAIGIPAQVLRQRPDVAAAEQDVTIAAEQVAQADAQRHPSVSLRASVQWSALTLGSLGSGAALRSLTAGLTQPLVDHGQRRAQFEAAQAAFEASQASYRAAVLTALQEVEDALSAWRANGERLERLNATAEAAGRASALASQRYASGLVDFQAVLETQRAWLNAQDGAAAAQGQLATAQVQLYKALGGGWTTKESGG